MGDSDGTGIGGVAATTRSFPGDGFENDRGFVGYLSEVVMYNVALESTEFLVVNSFLTKRYGKAKAPFVYVATHESQVLESDKYFEITVYRDGLGDEDLPVSYSFERDATESMDFDVSEGVITIPANQISASRRVYLINDEKPEPNETVTVRLQPSTAMLLDSAELPYRF